MKIAHILPTAYLSQVSALCGNFHMVMAHMLLEDQLYLDFYRQQKKSGASIIMDNSAYYFQKSVGFDLLFEALRLLEPAIIVLPDQLNDSASTIALSEDFLLKYKKIPGQKIMAVPQGKTLEEYLKCYQKFSTNTAVDMIGMGSSQSSRNIFGKAVPEQFVSGREMILHQLEQEGLLQLHKQHHLLGLSDSGHFELKRLKQFPFIVSCDSSIAFLCAQSSISIREDQEFQKPQEQISFQEKFSSPIATILKDNIQVLNQIIHSSP